MERYELVEGSAAKFWETSVAGATLTVRFGRIGTQGQSKDKTFSDAAAALKEKDKLVREKTAKGYVRADGSGREPSAPAAALKDEVVKVTRAKGAPAEPKVDVEPAPEPEEAVPTAPVAEAPPLDEAGDIAPVPSRKVFDGTPLPTRLRPGRYLTADEAWQALQEQPIAQMGHEACAQLVARKPSPDGLSEWIEAVTAALEEQRMAGRHRSRLDNDLRALFEAALRFFVESGGALAETRLADAMNSGVQRGYYRDLAWAEPLLLALRAALVHAPEAAYDAAVAHLNARIAEAHDWASAAAFAFVLADDRPAPHPLQPLAVLEAAEAAGIEVAADTNFLPLIVDTPPEAAARWRTKRSHHLYLCYCALDASEAAATLLAVANAAGQPALPGLDWLLHFTLDDERRVLAQAMLATGEAGVLSALLPHLHEKPIAAGLDAALAADPAAIVPRCLTALATGRAEPALRARTVRALDTFGFDTVRGWLGEGDGRAARVLDGLAESRAVPLAEPETWPRVLRDPPWRTKARQADDIVLAVDPLPTPFGFEKPVVEQGYWRGSRARVLADMSALPAFIEEAEAARPQQDWIKVPPASSTPPRDDPDALLGWLCARIPEIAEACRYWMPLPYHGLVGGLEQQPEPLALALWSLTGVVADHGHVTEWPLIVATMLDRFGEKAVPGLVALVETDPVRLLPSVLTVDAAALAPSAARALTHLKKAREPALVWLRRHRGTAITRLVPDAVGKSGPIRDAAEHALRVLAADRDDGRAEIERVAAAYASREPRVAEAVAQVLDRDPLARVPAKVARPPAWIVPGALTRPRLKEGGGLPDEAVLTLCEMLSFTNPDAVYAGVPMIREACTRDSLAAFAWDLFSAWTAAGTPSKDGWALRALGWFGHDATARDLTRLIRRWPGESAHARAVTGLDVLVDIGSDVALMNLNGIAEKLKFKGLQEKARAKIAQLAEARGLSPEELSDRLAPDLDLDERGGLDLDFGPRRFRAGFDEALKPWVKDESGRRLKDLPKPVKADAAEKAAAAVARWSALKKDARAVASLQVTRLEAMLATSRRVRPAVFGPFFAAHPLVRHLTQRLVWATYPDVDARSTPILTFRVAEDLGFTDAADEPIEIDLSEEASGLIGLVHPLHLDAGSLSAWGALFGDYEIAQPFPQLGRETHAFTETERTATKTDRFSGAVVEAKRLRGMAALGWPLGEKQDHGDIHWLDRRLTFTDGEVGTAYLQFSDGLFTGAPEFEDAEQTLGDLTLEHPWSRQASRRTFGDLDPVTASELLRGPSLLAGTRLR